MLSGFYSSATGMVNQSNALNHLTDNITNSLVPGYKRQETIYQSFDDELNFEVQKVSPFANPDVASGISLVHRITDFSQGHLKHTGKIDDVAIDGEGFFEVQTPHGQMYTRNGSFSVNSDGELVTKNGHRVLSNNGSSIVLTGTVPNFNGEYNVRDNGDVYVVDKSATPERNVLISNIKLVNFAKPENLERLGFGLWKNNDDSANVLESKAALKQGYQEMANINPVEAMVEMMLNQSYYDANAEVLKEMHSNMKSFISAVLG